MGHPDEMPDPLDQDGRVAGIARVWNLRDHVNLHLALVIKRGSGLQPRGGLPADPPDEIVQPEMPSRTHGRDRALLLGDGGVGVEIGREGGAGHDDRGLGAEKTAPQEIGDIHRGGVQAEVALAAPGAFDPIDMVLRVLAEKSGQFLAQFTEAAGCTP